MLYPMANKYDRTEKFTNRFLTSALVYPCQLDYSISFFFRVSEFIFFLIGFLEYISHLQYFEQKFL